MSGPPVLIDVVCPICDGVGASHVGRASEGRKRIDCEACGGSGELAARLLEAEPMPFRPHPGDSDPGTDSDTIPAPPLEEDTTP